jgi:hypothetical protein
MVATCCKLHSLQARYKREAVRAERGACEDHHPHACTDGLVFLTYTVFDEAVGEEVERLEVVPCRRCADSR